MFLRCLAFPRKDGSQRKYLQIVQTYREKGRVRQKIVANLGRLDELIASGTLEKLSDALSRYSDDSIKLRNFFRYIVGGHVKRLRLDIEKGDFAVCCIDCFKDKRTTIERNPDPRAFRQVERF